MENIILISSILAIHTFAWFTPGPNLVLVIRNALVYSRRTGFFTAVGFALSNFIHILLAVAGLGFLMSTFPLVATVIKFLGVGYLLYLGIKTLLIKSSLSAITIGEHHQDISPFAALKTGLVTNLLSPKAPPFFGSIFGTLLSSHAPVWLISFLVVAMPLNTLMLASLWSLFLSHHHVKKVYLRFQSVINKCLGVTLLIVAITIALSKS